MATSTSISPIKSRVLWTRAAGPGEQPIDHRAIGSGVPAQASRPPDVVQDMRGEHVADAFAAKRLWPQISSNRMQPSETDRRDGDLHAAALLWRHVRRVP